LGNRCPRATSEGLPSLFPTAATPEVAEVSIEKDGKVRVHRVVCAIDCGIFVNPDTVKAQVEGSIVWE
jgi:CO/xanthine dehydrogenase Mo-binding subunit